MSVATYAAAQLLRVLPRTRISQMVGRLCDQPLSPAASRLVTRVYSRIYEVDLTDAARIDGGAAYASFDAFFTRALRPGARVTSSDPLTSPADGVLESTGVIDEASWLTVKGKPYDVGELIGDPVDAARFAGGEYAVVYLSPRDYHRVHAPVDGVIGTIRGIPGDLYPVNAIGERHVPRLFARNSRVAICIDTREYGRVIVVMVGAMIVGRISVPMLPGPAVPPGVHDIEPPRPVKRGDEIGTFHLGSTAVVLVERGLTIRRPLGAVRFGQTLSPS
ncbi:MAG: archaetidylserine decarboxylase [Sorangiineae bacterium]|nr:archaetidylserine decarboxylase [Polyangiaceae bacterium]MEB2321135.1 archaetidylserine decarboxylase [Sorangiineae bacterium]